MPPDWQQAVTGEGGGSSGGSRGERDRGEGSSRRMQQNEGARRFYERGGLRAIRFTDGDGNEEKMPDVLYEWYPDRA